MRYSTPVAAAFAGSFFSTGSHACNDCFGPINKVEHVRHVKRMQPDAYNATYGPTGGQLAWGQLNFLHTVSLLSFPCSVTPMTIADMKRRPTRTGGWRVI